MTINIEINIEEPLWNKENRRIRSFIKSVIEKTIPQTELSNFLSKNIQLEISILLTEDKKIKDLNHSYRHKNKPTNVLSFPVHQNIKDAKKNSKNNFSAPGFMALGDIVLSYQTIKKEAIEQNKKFSDHLAHLLIHSLLHLIGYDHENDKDAKIMESLEITLLKKLAINNPYII